MTNKERWGRQLFDIAGAEKFNLGPLTDMDLDSQINYLKKRHFYGKKFPSSFDGRPVYPAWSDFIIAAHSIFELRRDERGKFAGYEELTLAEGWQRITEFGKIAHAQNIGNIPMANQPN